MDQPTLILDWFAILFAVLANFAFGFLWYGPFFGKSWHKAMGLPKKTKAKKSAVAAKNFLKIAITQLLSIFLTVYVLNYTGQIWRPSVWGIGPDEISSIGYGFFCGLFTFFGFYLPRELDEVLWTKRPWKVFLINAGFYFLSLQIMAVILAVWR